MKTELVLKRPLLEVSFFYEILHTGKRAGGYEGGGAGKNLRRAEATGKL